MIQNRIEDIYQSGEYIYQAKELEKILSHIEQLETDYKEANESVTWWQNRYNAKVEENEKLKHKLNDVCFSRFNDDVELALRYLRKIDYVDFDDERKVYLNKHNEEPFMLEDEREKDYFIKDDEVNEYMEQLEQKVEKLEKDNQQFKKQQEAGVEYIKENVYIDYYGVSVFREKDGVEKLLRMLGEKNGNT